MAYNSYTDTIQGPSLISLSPTRETPISNIAILQNNTPVSSFSIPQRSYVDNNALRNITSPISIDESVVAPPNDTFLTSVDQQVQPSQFTPISNVQSPFYNMRTNTIQEIPSSSYRTPINNVRTPINTMPEIPLGPYKPVTIFGYSPPVNQVQSSQPVAYQSPVSQVPTIFDRPLPVVQAPVQSQPIVYRSPIVQIPTPIVQVPTPIVQIPTIFDRSPIVQVPTISVQPSQSTVYPTPITYQVPTMQVQTPITYQVPTIFDRSLVITQRPESPLTALSVAKNKNILSTQSSLGPIPIDSVPAFAPVKLIAVSNVTASTIRDGLKSSNDKIKRKALESLENAIISSQGSCPKNIVDSLKIQTFQLDPVKMDSYLNGPAVFDHEFQDGMGCLIDALVADQGPYPAARLHRWISNIKRIGESSSEGMAFQMNSGSVPLYVLKVTSDPQDDNLAHEALIGMGALNRLRDKVPNFMHTYGAFYCSPPVMDANGNVTSWCPTKTNAITYLVLENIREARSLKAMLPILSKSEFIQIYLQILNALNVAYKEYDFTHYDLHSGNVLIQTLSYDIAIPLYNPLGGVSYIKTRYLARIIDYGMSHIYLQGQHFGRYGTEFAGVDANSSFPMFDAYKLLLFSALEAGSNSEVKDVASKIYAFFNENKSVDERLKERTTSKSDYFQPDKSQKSRTLDSLIEFILNRYTLKFVTLDQPIDALSTICQDNCVDWDSFNKIVFDRYKLPATLEDYCAAREAVKSLASNSHKTEIDTWLDQFNQEAVYTNERDIMINRFNIMINAINMVNLNIVTDHDFVLTKYINSLNDIAKIKEMYAEIEHWIQNLACVFNTPEKQQFILTDLSELLSVSETITTRLNEFQDIIQYNITNDTRKKLNYNRVRILHSIILNT